MASPKWGTDRPVTDLLFASGYQFDFFQAVWLLARASRHGHDVCSAAEPAAEAVRFHTQSSLAFPASAVAEIKSGSGGPAHMTITFLGLTGTKGALPTYYTELAEEQRWHGDTALADFLDVFNHRLISLFYRAWEKHHFVVGYERARYSGSKEDTFTSCLFHLVGLGIRSLRGRLPLPDECLLRYAGLLAQRPHSASALASLLRDYFGVPVGIDQFRGAWHALEEQDLSRLGADHSSSQLGLGTVAGEAIWTRNAKVRISFGPLSRRQFQDFLPDGNAFRRAASLIRLFLGDSIRFDIRPVLKAAEVPHAELIDNSGGPRLGWSGWLKTREFTEDAGEAVFGARELDQLRGAA
jgi:type VI secretion system protein ImpH